MSNDLFRSEAIASRGDRFGTPVRPVGPSMKIGVIAFLVLILGSIAFIATTTFARKETVPGWLIPDSGAIEIHSPRNGTLAELFVHDGENVRAGDAIAVVSTDTEANGASLGDSLLATSTAQRAAIHAELAAAIEMADNQDSEILSRQNSLRQQLSSLEDEIRLQNERLTIAKSTSSDLDNLLKKQLISSMQYRQAKLDQLQMEQELASKKTSLIQFQQEARKVALELSSAKAQRISNRAKYQEELSAVDEKEINIRAGAKFSILSNIDGQITSLRGKPGESITTDKTIAIVLPKGSKLYAELWAPSSTIAFLHKGTEVRLMYDAFPYQKFGVARGQIMDVAKSPTRPQEVPSFVRSEENRYRIIVALDREQVSAYGDEFKLIPGMKLAADLVLERRTLLEWLVDPLLAMHRRQN